MFERAKELALGKPPDFARAHQVLAECCTVDPGNTLFVQALLENLEHAQGKTAKTWPWQVWSLQRGLAAALKEQRYVDALVQGWALLGERPTDAGVLLKLAAVCAALDHQQTELMLLQTAHRLASNDPAVAEALSKALAGAGQFSAAARLRGESAGDSKVSAPQGNDDLVSAVEQAISQSQWDVAERLLAERSGAEGAQLRLRELGEEIMLGRAREKTKLAEEQAAREPSPRHRDLVGEVLEEQRRIELGVAFARYERFSSEPGSSWELAQCLSRVGNFSEAIKYLTPLVAIPAWAVRALVALGESWQQLRQFDRSLEFYEQAIALIDHDNPAEHGLKAWYRGAVLAEAMGRPGQARDWLARLVAADVGYKDAAARLVKLQAVCDKGGFPAEPAPSESAQLAAGNEVSEAISEDDLRTAGRDFHANHE